MQKVHVLSWKIWLFPYLRSTPNPGAKGGFVNKSNQCAKTCSHLFPWRLIVWIIGNKRARKSSAVCSFGACPIGKTISLSLMPWHHQPPITTEKVEQVLSVKPPAATVKSQRAAQVWGGVFLLPCFCIKLEKKVRSRGKPFLWKNKQTKQNKET